MTFTPEGVAHYSRNAVEATTCLDFHETWLRLLRDQHGAKLIRVIILEVVSNQYLEMNSCHSAAVVNFNLRCVCVCANVCV